MNKEKILNIQFLIEKNSLVLLIIENIKSDIYLFKSTFKNILKKELKKIKGKNIVLINKFLKKLIIPKAICIIIEF